MPADNDQDRSPQPRRSAPPRSRQSAPRGDDEGGGFPRWLVWIIVAVIFGIIRAAIRHSR